MRSLDDMRVFHSEPCGQHPAIAASEREHRAVLILGVFGLHFLNEAHVVHQGLVDCQVLHSLCRGEGLVSEGKRFSIVTMLTEENHCV